MCERCSSPFQSSMAALRERDLARAPQEAGVQAYFAGHDHNLEHIHVRDALPHYLISGGGSKSDRPFIDNVDSHFQVPALRPCMWLLCCHHRTAFVMGLDN